ncbi:hypothetical protein EVAR_23800_1 [Eumeta japonica]|uniref:Uncharacterized protein n=1 Tax=Eumeta variegata TaxID=151549 RepID=A0A4C1VMS0_EUMVA|nr:hypothetical protein EVAR_23800_1 [Eumeta japonica]
MCFEYLSACGARPVTPEQVPEEAASNENITDDDERVTRIDSIRLSFWYLRRCHKASSTSAQVFKAHETLLGT